MSEDGTQVRQYDSELSTEQAFLDRAYERLDDTRNRYRANQRAAEASPGVGNAQGLTERDAIAAHYGDQATRLEQVGERLVFGRIDSRDDEVRYIGRIGLRDEDGSRLLVDWRAPAARPFYQATAVDPQGVVRRRHIATRLRRVTGVEDELLDAAHAGSNGMSLQGEGALMSALTQARDGRMGDIVATIQGEQDRVIRAADEGIMVVQGGPGTGKTAVALHRAAYLLYAERERLERTGVLVVGPSRVFLRYIEQVLPSLGESGVVALTIGDLVPGIHATAQDTEEVEAAKGDEAWAGILRAAVRGLARVPAQDETLQVWNRTVVLHPADVAEARTRARRTGKPHNVAREGFALELVDVLARRLVDQAGDADPSDAEAYREEVETWRAEVRDSVDARRAINLAWMPTPATRLLERLYARPELLAELNASVSPRLSPHQLGLVGRPRGSRLTVSDVPLLDELEELLGSSSAVQARSEAEQRRREDEEVARAREAIAAQGLGGGIVSAEMLADSARGQVELAPLAERAATDRTWTYGHVVVDEAQELAPMAWRALLRRCPSRSFTVVGDLDQRRGHDRPSTWEQALGPAARALSSEHVLSVSYRTPRTLMELAEHTMAALGEPVRFPLRAVRDARDAYEVTLLGGGYTAPTGKDSDPLWARVRRVVEDETAHLDALDGEGRGRLAVLVATGRALAWGADTEGFTGLDQRVSLLGAVGAKGLEFDTVVLVEPSEVLADGPGDLFVALTRSTQRLHVVAAGELPPGMDP
ncbi:HelD family protein [Actinomyces polynesiensis]|uniref:HelD family protein n=1 Tax=Actinomyces polynesiensis TaxID=1325934 RepID=UPI0005B83280|nr:AAA family ATPase [Actinomyces polynesiensis]